MRHYSQTEVAAAMIQRTAAAFACHGANISGQITNFLALRGNNAMPIVESANAELIADDISERVSIRPHHTAVFLYSCAKAALSLRLYSMQRIINSMRERKGHCARRGNDFDCAAMGELLAVFNRLSPLVFSPRQHGMFSSLALIEFLAQYKHFPTWVWGVTTRPFAEHSWVQQDGWVFNEPVEYVLQFTPILAV